MRFRELLILKRREWIPILAAVLLNAVVGGWGMWQIMGQTNIDTMDADKVGTVCQIVNATKFIGIPLLLFAVGSWLIRFNRWIKEPKEA